MKKKLFLFTNNYPYGKGEQFLETEIQYLAEKFQYIYIFPMSAVFERRSTPNNVETVILDFQAYSTIKGIKSLGLGLFKVLFKDYKTILNKNNLSLLLRNAHRAKLLLNELKKLTPDFKNSVFYTYWFNDWASMLSMIKQSGIDLNFVSRAHGYDLYEYRNPNGYIPLRKIQIKYADKIFCISNDGKKYLSNKYPKSKNKVELSYLGVINKYNQLFNLPKKNRLCIVSCARLIPIKRINKLIDILSLIESEIKWIHFGEGELLDELKSDANEKLPDNIFYDFKGQVSNKEIYEFYNSNFIDLFVNLSESEGLPVSIMEAISFGIPILATDVGGTSEIVTEKTGQLIPPDFNIRDTAQEIEGMLKKKSRNIEYRKKIKEFWNQNFNAEQNYENFAYIISQL